MSDTPYSRRQENLTPDHWKIVGPISVLGRHYATADEAEAVRERLPDPDAHHLRAYNAIGKVLCERCGKSWTVGNAAADSKLGNDK